MGVPIRTPPYVESRNQSPHNSGSHSHTGSLVTSEPESQVRVLESRPKPQCWDHGEVGMSALWCSLYEIDGEKYAYCTGQV